MQTHAPSTRRWFRNPFADAVSPQADASVVPRAVAPHAPRRWALLVFERQRLRDVVAIGDGALTLGRDPACDITLPQRAVSRLHCTFRRHGDGVLVDDVSSTNGTFHDGRRLRRALLQDGDEVCVGMDFVTLADLAEPAWQSGCDVFALLYRDAASGLLNPRGFRIVAECAIATARPDAHAWLLAGRMQHGGDAAAASLAHALQSTLPASTVAGWTGRTEFAVLGIGHARDLLHCAEQLRVALHANTDTHATLAGAHGPAPAPVALRTLQSAAQCALVRAVAGGRHAFVAIQHSSSPHLQET